MRRLSIAVVLLLVAPLAAAQVYKWTDAQGTTHYSETPPPVGTKYSQVTVSGADVPSSDGNSSGQASDTAASSSSSSSNGDSNQTSQPDTPANRAKLCTSLQTNITALQGSGPVVMQGTGGNQQVLNADQRKQQLDASRSQYSEYCGSGQ
jgi:cytoskeletal protein RodZ